MTQDWIICLNYSLVWPIMTSSLGLRKGLACNGAHSFSESINQQRRHTPACQGWPSQHYLLHKSTTQGPGPRATLSRSPFYLKHGLSSSPVPWNCLENFFFFMLRPGPHPRNCDFNWSGVRPEPGDHLNLKREATV